MKNNTYVEIVNLDLLRIDCSYRTPECEVEELVKNFNPDFLGNITVNKRNDGSLYIVDGFRRVVALKEKGINKVYSTLHIGLTAEEEAKLFIAKNKFSDTNEKEAE